MKALWLCTAVAVPALACAQTWTGTETLDGTETVWDYAVPAGSAGYETTTSVSDVFTVSYTIDPGMPDSAWSVIGTGSLDVDLVGPILGTPIADSPNNLGLSWNCGCEKGDEGFSFMPTASSFTVVGTGIGLSNFDYQFSGAGMSFTETASAPEIDPASAASALTLLAGLLAVLRGRSRDALKAS